MSTATDKPKEDLRSLRKRLRSILRIAFDEIEAGVPEAAIHALHRIDAMQAAYASDSVMFPDSIECLDEETRFARERETKLASV